MTMGINITSNNAFKKLADKLKAEKNKKLEVGVMIPDVATYAMYLEYGWVHRVSGKQNAYLSGILDLPIHDKDGNYIQNFGTLHLPARPFMRDTYAKRRSDWTAKFKSRFLKTFDIQHSLGIMGQMATDDIKETIRNAGIPAGSFEKRSKLTMALLEARGEMDKAKKAKGKGTLPNNVMTTKPLTLSGVLQSSITWKVS